jgi:class 3 adenylate cyclase
LELPGSDYLVHVGDTDDMLDEIEEFLTGTTAASETDRALATVLFTDIVRSTELAHELGDRRWRDLLDSHHALVRRQLARFQGREVDTAGDGFFATFDGPARAIRCACAISDGVRSLGIEIRAGLHTGEVELRGDEVAGVAVHIGARVAAKAEPSEVLVSRTLVDLVAGSSIAFVDKGEHQLKGVAGEWRLFAVSR